MKDKDDIFARGAKEYAEKYGESMNRLAEELNKNVYRVPVKDPAEIIKKARSKRLRAVTAGLAAAACVLAFLILPPIINSRLRSNVTEETQTAADAPAVSAGSSSGTAGAGAFDSQISLLRRALPDGYTLSDIKLDNGKVICGIDDELGDDITLSISRPDGAPYDMSSLNEYDLGGVCAYGAAYPDYSLLRFDFDGDTYTLTSRYDLNSLLAVARALIASV